MNASNSQGKRDFLLLAKISVSSVLYSVRRVHKGRFVTSYGEKNKNNKKLMYPRNELLSINVGI